MGTLHKDRPLSGGYDGVSQLGSSMADQHGSYADGIPVRQSTSRPQSSYGNNSFADDDGSSSYQQLEGSGVRRSASGASRSNTLKKKGSVNRKGSLKRTGSRKSLRAGSIKGVEPGSSHRDGSQMHNVFYTPIPTSGSPTEVLANRFQAWRKMLKDLITYFREVQSSYEHRSKALLKVSNIINNLASPPGFMTDSGLNAATGILRDHHRQAIAEANKAKDIENDVINHLNGLRQDLAAKIKEIKSLSGDFKNSVDKEKDGTRKVVGQLEDALQVAEHDPTTMVGKDDPFIVRLAVDRQIERQIDEENYLHRAYLNLEGSGRELESIVVGEIQKAYNALAGILKREADDAYDTVEKLRSGPITLAKDFEWAHFVENDPHFISPEIPLRKVEDIEYPGKHAPAATEVRAGMLERKSKYLKSYTPGWYVLSPTHLHEFKSADRIYTQPPVMSLFLADQKLGSRSSPDSSSHKFMIKGKQTGSMHRGHSWVFRAESYDTMLAWYDDVKMLTEGSLPERTAFVRKHARSMSAGSVSGESVMDEDEADKVPFSTTATRDMAANPAEEELKRPQRPSPGGRFPSDFNANQHLRTPGQDRPLSPSSGSSIDERDSYVSGGIPPTGGGGVREFTHAPPTNTAQQGFQPRHQSQPLTDGADRIAAAPIVIAGTSIPPPARQQDVSPLQERQVAPPQQQQQYASPLAGSQTLPAQQQYVSPLAGNQTLPAQQQYVSPPAGQQTLPPQQALSANPPVRHDSNYGAWFGGAAAGAATGVAAEEYLRRKQTASNENEQLVSPIEPSEPIDRVSDAEKIAAATAMPPGIIGEGDVAQKAVANNATREWALSDAATAGTGAVAGLSGTRAITSIEDGGLAPGKEVVVEAPRAVEPVAASLPAPVTAGLPAATTATTAPVASQEQATAAATSTGSAPSAPSTLADSSLAAKVEQGIEHTVYDTSPLDGKVNAHPTGAIFPRVLRHDTNVSVADLHVPGEWKGTGE